VPAGSPSHKLVTGPGIALGQEKAPDPKTVTSDFIKESARAQSGGKSSKRTQHRVALNAIPRSKFAVQRWNLLKGDIRIGSLTHTRSDQPFHYYHFEPTAAFAEIAPLFATELRSLNGTDAEQWVRDYERIGQLKLALVSPDGSAQLDHFVLHVSGNEAWFRA
jgi:hypothetical protein